MNDNHKPSSRFDIWSICMPFFGIAGVFFLVAEGLFDEIPYLLCGTSLLGFSLTFFSNKNNHNGTLSSVGLFINGIIFLSTITMIATKV